MELQSLWPRDHRYVEGVSEDDDLHPHQQNTIFPQHVQDFIIFPLPICLDAHHESSGKNLVSNHSFSSHLTTITFKEGAYSNIATNNPLPLISLLIIKKSSFPGILPVPHNRSFCSILLPRKNISISSNKTSHCLKV